MRPADYVELGAYLRDVRQSRNLTIANAAQAMHIRGRYLEAMENGQFNALPGKTYIQGYIKNYALFLGVDPTKVIESYTALTHPQERKLFIPEPTRTENLPSHGLLLALALFSLLGLGYFMLTHYKPAPREVSVPEVPAHMMLEAYAQRNVQAAKWWQCLQAGDAGCFLLLHADAISNDALTGEIKPRADRPFND